MRSVELPVVVLLVVLAACGSVGSAPSGADRRIEAELFADPVWGTRVGIAVDFPEDRMVTGARMMVGERVLRASLYPLDGTDPEPPPDPLPIDAGVRVSVEANLPPDCNVPSATPVFVVTSKPTGGKSRIDRYMISNPGDFRNQARKVCRAGPQLSINGSTIWPDGHFRIGLLVTNPGGSGQVVSREWTSGHTRWRSAQARVPAGGSATLEITGTGQGCSHDGPWAHRLITLDGVELDPPAEGSADPC
ncbi:hypothetical protein [Marmoricola sp. URHB0036]|uniref:hypothetical protein n=1 Tax=Marmoricola sp. URHB0036 TaxID=1298863 RepID=UPI0004007D34|nr:hypothetical protein [Marmoricola sp. URHB0036]